MDVNEAPSGVLLMNTVLPPGVLVGDTVSELVCLDEDDADTHTFMLLDSAQGHFTVENNQLKVSGFYECT